MLFWGKIGKPSNTKMLFWHFVNDNNNKSLVLKQSSSSFLFLWFLLLCIQFLAVWHLADLVRDLIVCERMCFKGY